MTKKIIQVPVDEELLRDLDNLSKKQRKARSELVRQACMRYLQQAKNEELDRLYREGYTKVPEKPEIAEMQASISGEVFSGESW